MCPAGSHDDVDSISCISTYSSLSFSTPQHLPHHWWEVLNISEMHFFLEFKLLNIYIFFIIMCFMSGRWASAGAAGNTNKAEQMRVFSCRMNPSQMTVWSHARSHYYITATVLHHCTECFSMNYTERQRGRGTWTCGGLVSKRQSEHMLLEKEPTGKR